MDKRVLVIEDHEGILEVLSVVLTRKGFDVRQEIDGQKAMSLLEAEKFDVVVCDLMLSNIPGLEIIRRLRGMDPDVRIIAVSGKGRHYLDEAMRLGANANLEKPFTISQVVDVIDVED